VNTTEQHKKNESLTPVTKLGERLEPTVTGARAGDENFKFSKHFGLGLIFAVFGVFGSWASLAPLDGAAHAPARVAVKSYKKIVQHLEGGIVSRIYVQDGDHVEAGDTLLELDETQSITQLERANAKYVATKALEARLIAERDGITPIQFPINWSADNTAQKDEMAAQSAIFTSRIAALSGSVQVLNQRIEQLESQLVGLSALKSSKEMLAMSYSEELEDIESLLSQGFSNKERLRTVERNLASFEGEAAELLASISSNEIRIGEARLQILQLEREVQNEVALELSQAQTNLRDIAETITGLNDIVNRTKIKASVDGVINGMQAHTIGGIIGAGIQIAEIVPLTDELIVEARVSPLDVDRVSPGQEAMIRFSSFGNRTPTMYGELLNLSADVYADETTGAPYYLARIEVSADSIAALGSLALVPGMPAEAFIATGSRTLLQYMFKPFANTLARSFIED
jgi:epimerase transport system membrane fusion protein